MAEDGPSVGTVMLAFFRIKPIGGVITEIMVLYPIAGGKPCTL